MQTGQYAQYPNQPVREIDFGVISEGFNLIWRNLGPFVVTVVCMLLASGAVNALGTFLMMPMMMSSKDTVDLSEIFQQSLFNQMISLPFTAISYAVMGPFIMSIVMMTLKVLRGERPEFGDIALGFNRFVPAAVTYLVTTFMVTIGVYACCLPGFILGGLTMFAMPLIAERGLGPFEAIGESWNQLKGHLWMAMLFYFVVGLVSVLGVLACCVGILVTLPLTAVCSTLIYRDFNYGKGGMPAQPAATYAPTTEEPRQPGEGQ